MTGPILYIRSGGLRGLLVTAFAIIAIAAIFAVAIATETSLLAASFFAWLVVLASGEVRERLEQFGSVDEARRRLDQIEREGR